MSSSKRKVRSNNDPRIWDDFEQEFRHDFRIKKSRKKKSGGCCLGAFIMIIGIPTGFIVAITEIIKSLIA